MLSYLSCNLQYAVAENIHTPPLEGIGFSRGVGGSLRPNNLKKCMELIVISRGVRDLEKKPVWGRYMHFLELHNPVDYSLMEHPASDM